MKYIISLILFLSFSLSAFASDANWKIHPIFDEEVTHVVETPDYVYFTSRNLEENNTTDASLSLFRYDKKGEELLPLSTSNYLNGNNIRDIIYNPGKAYLAVLYNDYDIDLLYNNGNRVNIPYYKLANLSSSKHVNSMTVDAANDRLYLATDFGYVAINDKKNEIAESRIYSEPLKAFCRLGNDYLAIVGNDLLKSAVDSPHLSLDQFETVATLNNPVYLYPLNDAESLLFTGVKNNRFVKKLTFTGNGYKTEDLFNGVIYNIENNGSGVTVATGNRLYQFKADGTFDYIDRPEEYGNSAASTINMSEVWNGLKRKGLSSVKRSGDSWVLTRDWILPNAPATYVSTSHFNHPSEGFMMLSHGCVPAAYQLYSSAPFQLSSYKQGRWQQHSTSYTLPQRSNILTDVTGMVVDPDNRNYIYITSYHEGILRLNLNDPEDIIHMSRAEDKDNGKPGFVELGPVQNTSRGYWNIFPPYFDSKGNLWMAFANWDDSSDPNPHFYCWTADSRRATTSASNVILPEVVEFNASIPQSNLGTSTTLLKTGSGIHVYTTLDGYTSLALLDSNGTPLDTSDDKVYQFPGFYDTDGNELSLGRVRYIWEDPSTGYVWLCHGEGICYFVPSRVMNGDYQLNRIKVARNDGTNLADYLLEGVQVNHITADPDGRKWISTNGGGIICTTSDGREILEEFNTSNSPIPDDIVYSIGYNSDANSLMISTGLGIAEYFLPQVQGSSSKTDIKAYPNPVRPEFSGYVTISDIPRGSFVKITDSAGHLVKELGIMTGFEMLWDLSDTNFNRVKSGVYHILVSPSNESSSYSAVGKILVIS